MAETKIQGYMFDGDADGLKFLQLLDYEEFESLRYCVENKGEANFLDSKFNYHFEITKSSDGIYMISKVQPSSSSSWF
ncbi:MAG: hypothetical protein AAB784_03020 [Patescibacteria group bacterium]